MKIKHLLIISALASQSLSAQIVINEIQPSSDLIELKNIGSETEDASSLIFCTFPAYSNLDDLTIESGSLSMEAGGILVLSGHSLGDVDGELGLYTDNNFSNAGSIIDYMEYGTSGHARSSVAMAAGIWVMDDFVPFDLPEASIMYDGSGDSSNNWFLGSPTFGEENEETQEECNGGLVGTTDLLTEVEVIVGDGVPDVLTFMTDGSVGSNYKYIVTDDSDMILAVLEANSNDFEGAGGGVCHLWGVAYDGELVANADMPLIDISAEGENACLSISENFVEITRTTFVSVLENEDADYKFWPNPASNEITVEIQGLEASLISIIDLQGRTALREQVRSVQTRIDIGVLVPGNYILQVETLNGQALRKQFVKY